jgi:hypothetical protein
MAENGRIDSNRVIDAALRKEAGSPDGAMRQAALPKSGIATGAWRKPQPHRRATRGWPVGQIAAEQATGYPLLVDADAIFL